MCCCSACTVLLLIPSKLRCCDVASHIRLCEDLSSMYCTVVDEPDEVGRPPGQGPSSIHATIPGAAGRSPARGPKGTRRNPSPSREPLVQYLLQYMLSTSLQSLFSLHLVHIHTNTAGAIESHDSDDCGHLDFLAQKARACASSPGAHGSRRV
jgi:hypothetical protein